MISFKAIVVVLAIIFGMALGAPSYGGYHKHVRIIVPHHVHTVHHHHVEKIHVPVHHHHIEKVHVPVHHHVEHVHVPIETHAHEGWW
ncbi:uncharacterized histidine-rich protein DDB_G0274557-like [Sitophilus oryzae]|uniref:Uncharacterized histidine-rich protein DDB_G0274557-like n=1 Tax=Sitophilus oryzae TaxID=7048 RepID=A0A6J2YGS5_SITOR|nr:uncharacterized histidine-rich protein DDB_G0274557-like [Sitophilus oryzae]